MDCPPREPDMDIWRNENIAQLVDARCESISYQSFNTRKDRKLCNSSYLGCRLHGLAVCQNVKSKFNRSWPCKIPQIVFSVILEIGEKFVLSVTILIERLW